jgi:hypothetical protein
MQRRFEDRFDQPSEGRAQEIGAVPLALHEDGLGEATAGMPAEVSRSGFDRPIARPRDECKPQV